MNTILKAIRGQASRPAVKAGVISPMRPIPSHILCPDYYTTGRPAASPDKVYVAKPAEITKIRKSANLARVILDYACSLAKPGVSTDHIDKLCHEEMVRRGIYPSPINYCGFPKAICTSVNEVVCHGIPDSRLLVDGDVLSIDVSIFVEGFHGDNCGTVIVGEGDNGAKKLVSTTQAALDAAIAVCGPGSCLSSIGCTIQGVAEAAGLKVVEEFCGHGVGPSLHMLPFVLHYANSQKLKLIPGMIFTIEPILVEGNRRIMTWPDGWSAVSVDGGRGAQFEHQILITEHGCEILTLP